MLNAVKRHIAVIEHDLNEYNRDLKAPMSVAQFLDSLDERRKSVRVAQSDFTKALQALTPSLSDQELERYQKLKHEFETSRQ